MVGYFDNILCAGRGFGDGSAKDLRLRAGKLGCCGDEMSLGMEVGEPYESRDQTDGAIPIIEVCVVMREIELLLCRNSCEARGMRPPAALLRTRAGC